MRTENTIPPALSAYLVVTGIFCLAMAVLALHFGYKESFLLLNAHRNPVLELLFPHLTHLGDGLIAAGLLAAGARRESFRLVLAGVLAVILSGLLTQALKHGAFSDWRRPLGVFPPELFFHHPDHATVRNAFPSGHATTAAAAGFFWALRREAAWLWGATAGLLTALCMSTRVYLGAHFPGDLAAGGFVGLVTATLAWRLAVGVLPATYHRRLFAGVRLAGFLCVALGLYARYAKWWV